MWNNEHNRSADAGEKTKRVWISTRRAYPRIVKRYDESAVDARAQKVEHYEISGYGSAAHYAEMLGYEGIAARLRLTLEEEQQADTKLNFLAKNLLNPIAQSRYTEIEAI